ncbi:MAG: hypothetical protein KAR06_04235 [Deltaproteobacteria bacterium]|nr:hypothetical protein [Deltaproteobacteria bacterium]
MDKKTCGGCRYLGRIEMSNILTCINMYQDSRTGRINERSKPCAHYEEFEEEPTPTLYTIPPLEWEKGNMGNKSHSAKTAFGYYDVYYKGQWYWSDIDGFRRSCTSIEDGKAQAEAHYREQLGKCLEVYRG